MKNTQSEMVFPSKRLSASGGQYSALLSLLIISRKCVRGLQRSLGTVDWNRVFWGGSFIVQTVFLLGTFLWMSHMRRVLGSLGLDVKSIAALMRSHDPAHAASLIIKRQPALLGLARGVVEGLTKESGRVVVLPEVNRVLFDVSAKQTFRFLFDHMLINHEEELLPGLSMKSLEKNWGSFVVDLGAFDGIIASNSYNFMELGWRGLLVEPTPTTFDILKKTVARFGDRVNLENVVVGSEGKPVTFFIYDNPTSNSMYNRDPRYAKPKSKVHIQMWRASKLLVKHKVPKVRTIYPFPTAL